MLARPTLVALCLTALAVPLTGETAPLLGPIINPISGHTYFLLEETTWQEAETEAMALGGHLVAINDQAEQDWVWATFGGPRSLWLGMDPGRGWVTGEPLTYKNWSSQWPLDVGLDGESLLPTYWFILRTGVPWAEAGYWGDTFSPNTFEPLVNPIHGLAELATTVPEPSTFVLLLAGCIFGGRLRLRFRHRHSPDDHRLAG